ncbi:MAG: aminotransferase class I/II-fold pyridoxal phosphate-dependent enzyme [Cyclobacteriaceae bacterium]|nr:aminotransferase class I/II-fold pyridoxal phosphate-dependent enzyme [Cyclobacteriaceae bacterium]
MIEIAERFKSVKEYYFSVKLQEISKMRSEGIEVLNLGIGSPDLPPDKAAIDALINSVVKSDMHAYQPYRSGTELRESMSKFYENRYNVNLNSETEVLPLLGSKEGIMYISLAFLNPGDEVLIPNPGYPAYSAITTLVGATVRSFDLVEENDWLPDFEALEGEDLSKVKIMWVNYPNMPTGTNASAQLFKKLIEFGKKYNILIINDNPYSLVLNEFPQSILKFDTHKEHVLELNSLSKSFNMAGWRVGMVAGHKQYINAILQAKSNVDSGMFLPVQKAASQALTLPQKWHDERNSVYAKRKKIALELLNHLDCEVKPNQVGMFLWAKLPAHIESVRGFIDDILHNTHVFLTPGEIFGTNGNRFIRLSLCSTEQDFELAIQRILKWKAKELSLVS